MTRLLRRTRITGAVTPPPPEPSPTVIAVQAERWAAGSGTTLTALGVPLQQGQLTAANVGGVSVWLGGVEVPVYAECLGVYPDGTARSLYLQASQTLTNGSPVAGEIRLTGGFTQPRRALVDNSATFVNNGTGTAWNVLGLPEGAIVATSAAHKSASMLDGPLVPMATQPVFSGSAAVDATLINVGVGLLQGRTDFPQAGATYDTGLAMFHLDARTESNSTYLRLGLSWTSKERTAFWAPASPVFGMPENRVVNATATMWYLLTRDTTLYGWLIANTETQTLLAFLPRTSSSAWNSTPIGGAREAARWTTRLTAVIQANPLGAARMGAGTAQSYQLHAEQWLDRLFTAPLWNGSAWTAPAFADPALTIPSRPVLPFQNFVLCRAIIDLCNVIADCPAKTSALANVSAALLWLRQNLLTTSSGGTTCFRFASETYHTSSTGGTTAGAVDLNGFPASLYALRALRENSVADANLARTLYASIGLTPRDGHTGPFISAFKQWDEAFHQSQRTMGYLAQAGI